MSALCPGQNKGSKAVIRKGQKRPFRKCTEAEREERIETLANLIADKPLTTHGQLKKFLRETYNIQYRMAHVYIARAREFNSKRCEMPKKDFARICISKLLHIIQTSRAPNVTINAIARLAAMRGIDEPSRHEVAGPGQGPIVTREETQFSHPTRERAAEILDALEREAAAVIKEAQGNGVTSNGHI